MYLRTLRQRLAERGSADGVYIDESGFEPVPHRHHGWSPRGHKVYGNRSGHRRPREHWMAAQRGPDFLAPTRFSGTTDAALVNAWLRHLLCKEPRPHSTLISDHAAFHKKKDLEAIAQENGHHILCLPPHSPDLNPIEHDFANLKKRRQFAPSNTSLADLIKSYGNYCP